MILHSCLLALLVVTQFPGDRNGAAAGGVVEQSSDGSGEEALAVGEDDTRFVR